MADQIAAVIGSVRQAFPSHEVWGTREGDRAAHTVSVAFDDGVLLLTASYEFLGGKAPSDVLKYLTKWKVADGLRSECTVRNRLLVTWEGRQVIDR